MSCKLLICILAIELQKPLIMSESKRISNLYQSIYNGNPWLEVTLADTLKDVTAEQAYRKIKSKFKYNLGNCQSSYTMEKKYFEDVCREKQLLTPDHNYFVPVLDPSEAGLGTIASNSGKITGIMECFFEDFKMLISKKYIQNNNHTYYEHIHGIIQHDVYHLGQIVILKKLL